MVNISENEVNEDLQELRNFETLAKRQAVKNLLSIEIRRLETQLTNLRQNTVGSGPSPQTSSVTPQASGSAPLPTVKITNYSWDQSDKFVKFYITVAGVQNVPATNVTLKLVPKSFTLNCADVAGKNHELTISGLLYNIDPAKSEHKVKTDSIVVMLKKVKEGQHWESVTEQEQRTKDKKKTAGSDFGKDSDPSASLMKMMKDMYEEGDDDMKRTIKKAWFESQQKKAGGGGDLGFDANNFGDD